MALHSDVDLLNPPASVEKNSHKLKRLVQSPNSFFMDVSARGASTSRRCSPTARASSSAEPAPLFCASQREEGPDSPRDAALGRSSKKRITIV
eukprot:CAMPEP_0197487766 /NCGR_PEP_ID=MMETSP1311-20131121/2790_1 /TAXON_ID=464262 /ORGANISM="Genus nov. species nov., Strain RCC856" /LENGTH=92 /DNA_ID=CAMNT_0043031569 /DNA_START=105 /DNA_END=384 /DNA_ORIENTATION=+